MAAWWSPLPMSGLAMVAVGFISGALPFSVWIGQWFLKKDIRLTGDGNPGAVNVFRAGSSRLGWLAIVLDFAKAWIPVFLLYDWAASRSALLGIAVAVAPVFGHAFTPFLGGRGGKAVVVTFGIWSGLTLGLIPIVMGIVYAVAAWVLRLRPDGWTVMLGLLAALGVLAIIQAPSSLYVIWMLNAACVGYKHRGDLGVRPFFARRR